MAVGRRGAVRISSWKVGDNGRIDFAQLRSIMKCSPPRNDAIIVLIFFFVSVGIITAINQFFQTLCSLGFMSK